VSDPSTLIATLEERFGVMYHVRLDCVLTLVDLASVAADIEDKIDFGASAVRPYESLIAASSP